MNCTQLAEHTAGTAHMGDEKPDTLCKRTESPHRSADGRYGLAQHNEQRTDGCRQEPDLDDRFPGTLIHAVELVH